MILAQINDHEKYTGALKVELRIYRKRKSAIAKNFGDADNLAKPILDAITMTGAVWHDDRQVVEMHVWKLLAPEPRVEMTIEEADCGDC